MLRRDTREAKAKVKMLKRYQPEQTPEQMLKRYQPEQMPEQMLKRYQPEQMQTQRNLAYRNASIGKYR